MPVTLSMMDGDDYGPRHSVDPRVSEGDDPVAFLHEAYSGLTATVRVVDDEGSWAPTACTGWGVRDLVHHCWGDAQRALVALHTPADGPADTDAVTYWTGWGDRTTTDPEAAANGRRYTRVVASMFRDWAVLREGYLQAAAAVLHAVGPPGRTEAVVATQGHRITVADLASTLAVEATVHHLDLVAHLDGAVGPSVSALRSTRAVVDRAAQRLGGAPLPATWDDTRCVLLATGRARPSREEADALGGLTGILPIFS